MIHGDLFFLLSWTLDLVVVLGGWPVVCYYSYTVCLHMGLSCVFLLKTHSSILQAVRTLCWVCVQPAASSCIPSTTLSHHILQSVWHLYVLLSSSTHPLLLSLSFFPLQVHVSPSYPPYSNLYINHHPSSSSSLLPTLPCVGGKLRLYFPFWYCIVNALLHPIQLRCCGNTV